MARRFTGNSDYQTFGYVRTTDKAWEGELYCRRCLGWPRDHRPLQGQFGDFPFYRKDARGGERCVKCGVALNENGAGARAR
jgi:hypothetical protein